MDGKSFTQCANSLYKARPHPVVKTGLVWWTCTFDNISVWVEMGGRVDDCIQEKIIHCKKSGKKSSCNRSSSCHHCSCKTPGLAQQVAYCSLHWPHLGGLWRYWFLTWQVWTLQCAFITTWVTPLAHCAQSQSSILLLPLSSPAGFLFSPRHPEISKEGMINRTPFSHSEVSSSTWAHDSAGRVHSPGGNSEC